MIDVGGFPWLNKGVDNCDETGKSCDRFSLWRRKFSMNGSCWYELLAIWHAMLFSSAAVGPPLLFDTIRTVGSRLLWFHFSGSLHEHIHRDCCSQFLSQPSLNTFTWLCIYTVLVWIYTNASIAEKLGEEFLIETVIKGRDLIDVCVF